MSKKELAIPSQHFFTISFSDGFNTLQYYKQEVERLKEVIADYKHIMNDTYKKRDYMDELRKWKHEHSLQCILITGSYRISPYQCGDMIKGKRCTFYEECIPRKEYLKKIIPI